MEMQAILLLIFIILAYGVWGFMLKSGVDKIGLWSAVGTGFATSIVMGIVLLSYALSKGAQLSINTTSVGLVAAVVFANLAILATFVLLEKNYVSLIIPLTELYLAITVLLGVFVLGERLTVTQIAGVIFAVVSAILLSL